MSYRLNKAYIREYAAEVASSICDEFYRENDRIEGKHLVNLTEIRQINLFLVKKMYLRWQEEGAALHSPFFNYTAPEVRQSFNKLMNVLSKNISISRGDFEAFLSSSILETLYFLIDPAVYFEELYDSFTGKIYVKNQILPLKKYYRYHFPLIEKYFDALQDEGNKIKAKKALKVLNKCTEKYPALLSNTSEVISEFDTYKTFILDKAYLQEDNDEEEQPDFSEDDFVLTTESENEVKEKVIVDENDNEETFEFEDFSNEDEKLGTVAEADTSNDKLVEKKEEIVAEQQVAEKQKTVEEQPKEETNSWKEEENKLEVEKQSAYTEISENKEKIEEESPLESIIETDDNATSEFGDFMLKDEIEEEATGITKAVVPDELEKEEAVTEKEGEASMTLLEKLQLNSQKDNNAQGKNTLISEEEEEEEEESPGFTAIQEKLIQNEATERKSLKGNIPLNMKMRYKKELFGDDQTEFESAIDLIDNCGDYHEAIKLLKEKYVNKYSWDFSEESTRDFLSMVDNNFH